MLKLLIFSFLIVSCASKKPKVTYIFTHPTKTTAEYYKDDSDCSVKAGQANPALSQTIIAPVVLITWNLKDAITTPWKGLTM